MLGKVATEETGERTFLKAIWRQTRGTMVDSYGKSHLPESFANPLPVVKKVKNCTDVFALRAAVISSADFPSPPSDIQNTT